MGSEIINHVSVREPGLRGRCWQRCARRAGAELWDLGMGGLWGLWWELWGVEVGSCGGVRWQLWDVWWGAFGIWEFLGMCGEEFWGCAMGFGSEDAQCRSTQCWELGLIKKSLQDSWRHLLSAATSAGCRGTLWASSGQVQGCTSPPFWFVCGRGVPDQAVVPGTAVTAVLAAWGQPYPVPQASSQSGSWSLTF